MSLFSTARLVARRLVIDDVPAMLAIYGDLETVRYVGDSKPITEEECVAWISVTDKNFEKRGYGMVGFEELATGQIIGCGGIVHPGQQVEPEVKYAFRRDKWGQGFATEAVPALIAHARKEWNVRDLIATVDPENQVSQHLLTKMGFRHVDDRIDEDGFATQVWEQLP